VGEAAPIIGILRENRFRWFGHIMRRADLKVLREVMDVDGEEGRGKRDEFTE